MTEEAKVVEALLEAISWSLHRISIPMRDQDARDVHDRLLDAKLAAERAMAPKPPMSAGGPPDSPLSVAELAARYREVKAAAGAAAEICAKAHTMLVDIAFRLAEASATAEKPGSGPGENAK